MSGRRDTTVYPTATPWATGPMPDRSLPRTWRRTPGVIESQPTGTRDAGGQLGTAFHLPSFDTNASTTVVATPPPGAAVVPEPSDCCG